MAPAVKDYDDAISPATRSRLRAAGNSCVMIPGGPKLMPLKELSAEGARSRQRRRGKIQHILVGASGGRSGSTNLAVNLQVGGRKKECRVTHERFNPKEADHKMAEGWTDKFSYFSKSMEVKNKVASDMVMHFCDTGGGRRVVGDVAHTHSQMMESFLLADPRVILVVQTREPVSYSESFAEVSGQPRLWETHLLNARGITASKTPDRLKRLQAYQKMIAKEGLRLKRKYKNRVMVIDVKKLSTDGPKLLKKLNLRSTKWEEKKGRNSRGGTSRLMQKVTKRILKKPASDIKTK